MLEYHVHRPLVGRDADDRFAAQPDIAPGRLVESGDHAQRRGLAAAGRAEKREKRPAFDRQAYVIDRDDIAESLGDIDEFDIDGSVQPGLRRIGKQHAPPGPCRPSLLSHDKYIFIAGKSADRLFVRFSDLEPGSYIATRRPASTARRENPLSGRPPGNRAGALFPPTGRCVNLPVAGPCDTCPLKEFGCHVPGVQIMPLYKPCILVAPVLVSNDIGVRRGRETVEPLVARDRGVDHRGHVAVRAADEPDTACFKARLKTVIYLFLKRQCRLIRYTVPGIGRSYVGCEKYFQIGLAACCLKKGRRP